MGCGRFPGRERAASPFLVSPLPHKGEGLPRHPVPRAQVKPVAVARSRAAGYGMSRAQDPPRPATRSPSTAGYCRACARCRKPGGRKWRRLSWNVRASHSLPSHLVASPALSLDSSPFDRGGEGPGEGDGVICGRSSQHRCLLKRWPPGRPAREALQASPAGK